MAHKMAQRFLVCTALAGVSLLGIPASSQQAPDQPPSQGSQQQQDQQATKSVTGTIAAIGNGGHSFTLQVGDNSKRTMEFMMGKTTQVKGQVRTGTPVTVEYQTMASGENVAVTVTAQG